jgi:hypothetical protein
MVIDFSLENKERADTLNNGESKKKSKKIQFNQRFSPEHTSTFGFKVNTDRLKESEWIFSLSF